MLKRIEKAGGQIKEDRRMAVTPENTKQVDNYFTAEILAHGVNAAFWISSEVVVDLLDAFGSDCDASIFLGLASSGHTPSFFKALDDPTGKCSS